MILVAPRQARIIERHGRRFWTCWQCGRTLGELVDGLLIIRANGRIIQARITEAEQICPACLARSEVTKDMLS